LNIVPHQLQAVVWGVIRGSLVWITLKTYTVKSLIN
jgi:hypothetical protein